MSPAQIHTVSGTSFIESIIEEGEEDEGEERMNPDLSPDSHTEPNNVKNDICFELDDMRQEKGLNNNDIDLNNNENNSNYEHQNMTFKEHNKQDLWDNMKHTPVIRADQEKQIYLLRDLLRIERQNNDRRRANNTSLQQYIQQLQTDYLKQQKDLVETLEMCHKIKHQKEAQLDVMRQTLDEKEKLIDQLRVAVDVSNNEDGLRKSFQESLDKQKETSKLERNRLQSQIEEMEKKMAEERINNSKILLQFQEKMDEKSLLHEQELSKLRERLQLAQSELNSILNEPHSLIVKALREDKARLEEQIDELQTALCTSQNKFEGLRTKIDMLIAEHEQLEQESQNETNKLQERINEHRRTISDLRLELEDKQEVIHVLEFNLQRSEKRAKNLVGAMKGKESTYKEIIDQIESSSEQEIGNHIARLRVAEKRLQEFESQLGAKQNELVRIQMEHENQLESLRNDRDERINKLMAEKQRLEYDLSTVQSQLEQQNKQSNEKCETIESLKRELNEFKTECRRLSNDLAKSEASLQSKHYEVQQILKVEQQRQKQASEEYQQASQRELEEALRMSKRLEASANELRRDNERLRTKLCIAESNMSKMTYIINREREKLVEECEKKLNEIRAQHNVFLKNKLRYKHYGHKLKKYCEHLRQVHQHLCDPRICGQNGAIFRSETPPETVTNKILNDDNEDPVLANHPSQIKPVKLRPYQLIC